MDGLNHLLHFFFACFSLSHSSFSSLSSSEAFFVSIFISSLSLFFSSSSFFLSHPHSRFQRSRNALRRFRWWRAKYVGLRLKKGVKFYFLLICLVYIFSRIASDPLSLFFGNEQLSWKSFPVCFFFRLEIGMSTRILPDIQNIFDSSSRFGRILGCESVREVSTSGSAMYAMQSMLPPDSILMRHPAGKAIFSLVSVRYSNKPLSFLFLLSSLSLFRFRLLLTGAHFGLWIYE